MPAEREHAEASGYDLSSTGTIVEASVRDGPRVGWNVKAGTAVDLVVEVRGDDTDWITHKSVSSATDENDGATIPEARYVRIQNTTTAADTADALLGVSE